MWAVFRMQETKTLIYPVMWTIIGGGSYWARRAVVRSLFGLCGPLLCLSRPLLTAEATHNYSFTSWIPSRVCSKKHPTRWLLWHSDVTKSISDPTRGSYDAPPGSLIGWGGGYSLPIPHLHRRLWCWSSVPSGPPTFSDASAAYVDNSSFCFTI